MLTCVLESVMRNPVALSLGLNQMKLSCVLGYAVRSPVALYDYLSLDLICMRIKQHLK